MLPSCCATSPRRGWTCRSGLVLDLLRDLSAEGLTVVMVTHDPLAAAFAHRRFRTAGAGMSPPPLSGPICDAGPLHNLLGGRRDHGFHALWSGAGQREGFRRAALLHHAVIGQNFLFGAIAVSAAGMLLILLLAGVAMAQTVRLRLYELGVLKALGFSTRRIVALMVAEATAPCLAGAALGLIAAKLLSCR